MTKITFQAFLYETKGCFICLNWPITIIYMYNEVIMVGNLQGYLKRKYFMLIEHLSL